MNSDIKNFNNRLFSVALCIFIVFSFLRPVFSSELPKQSEISKAAFIRAYPRLKNILKRKKLNYGAPVFIRIFKLEKELEIWLHSDSGLFKRFKTYAICHHSGTLGPKQTEGDKQSPEGFYSIERSQLNPWSKYHLSFNLGYPNDFDLYHNRTGKALMIHGRCSSVGCFAMTDYYMDEIYSLAEAAIAHGQQSFQVHIFPFRFNNEWQEDYRQSRWNDFWKNLEEGYTIFERNRIPPEVSSSNGKYFFSTTNTSLVRKTKNIPPYTSAVIH